MKHCTSHTKYYATCWYCRSLNPPFNGLGALHVAREIDDDGSSVLTTLATDEAVSDILSSTSADTSSSFDSSPSFDTAPDTSSFDSGFGGDSGGGGASGDF